MKSRQVVWIVAGAYAVLTVLYLFPLFRNFSGLAGHGDAWQFVWNIWWIKYAWAHDVSIWYTNMLHWPSGIPLILQTFTLASSLPAAALSYLIGLVPAYNVMVIVHFVFSGLGMYLLCWYITRNTFASFLGGFLFTFSPYHFVHFYGHLHLLAIEVFPFAVLFLLRTLEGKKWDWIGAGIVCGLTAYVDWYYLFFLFLIFAVIIFWNLAFKREARTRGVLLRLGLIVLCAVIIALPYLGTVVHGTYHNPDFDILGHDPLLNSTDLKSFFIPGGRSVYQEATSWYWDHWPAWRETGSYIGYTVIVLLLWGLWKACLPAGKARSNHFFLWSFLGILFAVLSLGPYLQIGGRIITSFHLPYYWLAEHISILQYAGVPVRFFVVTLFCLAILTSKVITRVLTYRHGMKIAIIFFILLAFEYLPAPVEVSAVTVSPFYETLRSEPGDFAVIDRSDAEAKVLYYQTIHEKHLIGGYTTRPTVSTERFLKETDFMNKKILQELNVRYILTKPDEILTFPLVYQDSFLTAYQVPQ